MTLIVYLSKDKGSVKKYSENTEKNIPVVFVIIRALNDIGYSLADGWSSGMREQFEHLDDEGKDAIGDRRRQRLRIW